MGYVENNLLKGEEIIYKATIHWAIFLPTILWVVLAIIFASAGEDFVFLTGIFGLLALFSLVKAIIRKLSSEYVLTDRRLILKSGIISRNTLELMLVKCEGVSVNQGIFGRLLGYGTILATTGGASNKFTKIADPIVFRNRINEQLDVVHSNK